MPDEYIVSLMSSKFSLETLPNGLDAIFINQPHWVSNSARLIVNAGSLHEDDSAPTGVAHFFEHVTFQGTDSFPSVEDLNDYADDNGISKNAFTSRNQTRFVADGFDLEPVIEVVTQLALAPKLDANSLERERNAIVDEARSHQFRPDAEASRLQQTRYAGKKFARLCTGTVDEIMAITPDHLQKFHEQHYRLGNMLLVVCTGLEVDDAREKTIELIDKIDIHNDAEGESVLWDLPFLAGNKEVYSVNNGLPEQSQSTLSLNYFLERSSTVEDQMARNLASAALNKAVLRRIRTERVLAYAASAGVNYFVNSNFGADEKYISACTTVSTSGDNIEPCLEELLHTIPSLAVNDTESIAKIINTSVRYNEIHHENKPKEIADVVDNSVLFNFRSVYDMDLVTDIVKSMTVDRVAQYVEQLVADLRLVQITSPNAEVVEAKYDIF